MKQIVTIFRAEGPQARRLLRLCRTTRKAELCDLRDVWRQEIRTNAQLSAYWEYMDGWSMFDDFRRVMGVDVCRREMRSGELYFRLVGPKMLAELRLQAKRKQQFVEQTEFVWAVATLAEGSGMCAPPVALAVFREVVGGSILDEEMDAGSNQPLNGTVRSLPARYRRRLGDG